MAIDADGNFFNPYSPGSYEYEMEEGTRGQEPGTGGVVTTAQTPDILRVQQPTPPAGFNTFNQITGLILSVATLSVPLLGEMIGASILEGLGVTEASAAVEAGVGAAALSAGSTAAQGGSVEDVLKSAATAGFASGINVGMGGGVAGAATGSFVGSAIQGGGVDQVLTNAIAAGAGAGVQGVLGPAAGTIVRDLIKTGEVSDRTLINAAVSELSAWNKTGDRQAPIVEGQPIAPPAAEEPVPTSISLEPKAETPVASQEPAGPTLPTVTTEAQTVAPTVTDVDVMKQVSAQQPTVPLEKVTVSGQGANVAPVETAVPSETVPSEKTIPSPTPAQPFPTPTITAEEKKEAPVVTDISTIRPDTTAGLAPPQADLGTVNVGYVTDPFVDIAPPAAEQPAPTSISLNLTGEEPAPSSAPQVVAPPAVEPPTGPVLETKTIAETSPVVSPVVTDLDLVKQVAAQPTPTVDPKALERVIVQGQGANVANVAPVETTVPSATVLSTATVATPTPAQPFPTPTITPVAEPEKEAPVVTDIPPVEPPQTEFEKKFISETVPAPVTTGPEFQQVTVRETVPPPVAPGPEFEQVTVRETVPPPVAPGPEFEQKTIRETVPKVSDVVTETPAPPSVAQPSVAQPTELEKVTVTAKREEESPTITDIVAKTMEPPPAPPPPAAPEVKTEEPKKEEPPKKETKKLYPTVTSVPPPKKPGRQPIITGASPARLLADALAAYRPAGAIEGEESGKERQNVWNEKSLRLKDALGL
jgi:hypothetical protein